MALSAFNALTLTPALSALLLGKAERPKGMFFRGVNRVIDGGTQLMVGGLRGADSREVAWSRWSSSAALGLTYSVYGKVPTGFVPARIKGT